jgi:hypothetical protein
MRRIVIREAGLFGERGNMLVARAVWIAVDRQVQLGKALAGKTLA